MWPIFHCVWEAALHWDLIVPVVLSFSEIFTFYLRTVKTGHSPVSHVTPLQPMSHSQEPSPSTPLLHFPWTQVHTVGEMGGSHCPWKCGSVCRKDSRDGPDHHHLLMAPSALGCLKKGIFLCLLVSNYKITLNSNYAYLSSIPKCWVWNGILKGKNWWKIAVLKRIVLAGLFSKSVVCQIVSSLGIREKTP